MMSFGAKPDRVDGMRMSSDAWDCPDGWKKNDEDVGDQEPLQGVLSVQGVIPSRWDVQLSSAVHGLNV